MKFLELPKEKQLRVLNAGYKVFAYSSYKKASMQQIADEAMISKSLLFHYFYNKQALYEYLFKSAILLIQENKSNHLFQGQDLFDALEEEVSERLKLMDKFPVEFKFIMRVYDDSDSEIKSIVTSLNETKKTEVLCKVDRTKFHCEGELETLYDMILDLANGFYYRVFHNGELKYDNAILEFKSYISSLKRNYYKEV